MANRFWVGGSGDWSDYTHHWSDSSGGSPGVAPASNVITNGDFSDGLTGWNPSVGVSVVSGACVFSGNGNNIYQNPSVISGHIFRITFNHKSDNGSPATIRVTLPTQNFDFVTTSTSFVSETHDFTIAPGDVSGFFIEFDSQSSHNIIDDVSFLDISIIANNTLPTSSDNVFIDSNSGLSGGTITLDINAVFNNITSTLGHNYTIDGTSHDMQPYGSITLESGLSTIGVTIWDFYASTIGKTITINGATLDGNFFLPGTGGWILQDNLSIAGLFNIENGTFDANGHNVSAKGFYFYANNGFSPSIKLGSGIWTITGNDTDFNEEVWYVDEFNGNTVSFTPGTSTIKFTDVTSNDKTFANYTDGVLAGAGHIYNNIWFTGSGTGKFIITGSNTFNDFKVDTPPHTVRFLNGTTNTVTTFTVNGTAGNLITLQSDTTSPFTLVKSGGGQIVCDFLSISYSTATPSNIWIAGENSIDGGNNSGWIFNEEWTKRTRPTTSYSKRTKPSTSFSKRTLPSTNWTKRTRP